MADRRMLSLKVVDTDNFLNMSISARLLYYDFVMRADTVTGNSADQRGVETLSGTAITVTNLRGIAANHELLTETGKGESIFRLYSWKIFLAIP